MCTSPLVTTTHSSNSGVCHGSAHPPLATTRAIEIADCPLLPLPANSVMETSGVSTTATGGRMRGIAGGRGGGSSRVAARRVAAAGARVGKVRRRVEFCWLKVVRPVPAVIFSRRGRPRPRASSSRAAARTRSIEDVMIKESKRRRVDPPAREAPSVDVDDDDDVSPGVRLLLTRFEKQEEELKRVREEHVETRAELTATRTELTATRRALAELTDVVKSMTPTFDVNEQLASVVFSH
eukprot:29361-Pelagococcus_subviridis.AAC.1